MITVPRRRRMALVLGLVLATAITPAGGQPTDGSGHRALTLLITSGTGGRLVADEDTVATLAGTLRREAARARAAGREVLVLDAGRTLLPYAESRSDLGRTMLAVLESAGCQALALAPMDTGLGGEELRRLAAEASFPILGSEVPGPGGERDPLAAVARVQSSGGLSVAVVNLFARAHDGDLRAAGLEPGAGVRELASRLEAGLVVGVVHSEGSGDLLDTRTLTWRLLEEPGALRVLVDPDMGRDLLLRIESADDPVFLVGRRQGGDEPWSLARVDLELVANGGGAWRPVEASLDIVPADPGAPQDPRLVARVWATMARFRLRHADRLPAAAPTDRPGLERFVLEAMREAARAEVAILNRGGLRPVDEAFFAGDRLRREAVVRMLSLPQQLARLRLSGAELERLARESASRVDPAGEPRKDSLHLFGLGFEVVDGDLENVRVNGRPLHPADDYTVVTTTYLLDGGDGYQVLAGHDGEAVRTAGRTVELREDVVLPRLERAAAPFPDLAGRPVWRLGVDRLAASLEGVRTSRDPSYDDASDSRAAAEDSSSVLAETLLRADRELPAWRWENRLRGRFGLLDTADSEAREIDDDLRLDSSVVFTGSTVLGGASPFVGLVVDSELRRNRGPEGGRLPRQLEESLSAGLTWERPRWPRLRLGAVARHYSHVDRDSQLGITAEAVLQLEPSGGWPGLQAMLLAEHLRDSSSSLSRLDLDLRGIFPVRGALAFTPALNLYLLDDSTRAGSARYARLTLGLSYSWSGRTQTWGDRD